jgi:hypothetical protein
MSKTNHLFKPGKLAILLDQHAGSSGKGKVASYITEHADNWQFCCNTFAPQAGHWVKLDDGRKFFYQTFNSCSYQTDRYEKMYVGAGGIIELDAFWREKEENNIPSAKIGISPVAAILQDIDGAFERGEVDLDGNRCNHEGTMKRGSTCHGVGACNARKVLRRPNVLLARDVPELEEFLCDVPGEILTRLDRGQAGFMEIAQGFVLSMNLPEFYPYCTSRSVTVSTGLSDMMLPPKVAGNVVLNCRTFPIRINSNKYIDPANGQHLTWNQVKEYEKVGKEISIYEGNSGPWYEDQEEITWETLTELSGSPMPIVEFTSVTKLPRRVATWSRYGLEQAVRYNKTDHSTYLSINFINYVDHQMLGKRSRADITDKVQKWIEDNLKNIYSTTGASLLCLGTGPLTDDTILIHDRDEKWREWSKENRDIIPYI